MEKLELDKETRRRMMIVAVKTPDGREAIKTIIYEMYPEETAQKIVDALDAAAKSKISNFVNTLFKTINMKVSIEEKGKMLLGTLS